MAARSKWNKRTDHNMLNDKRTKNVEKKSPPVFVPLDGLSQSAKDRQMNNRTVKPPRNLKLVEGEPGDKMEFQKRLRQNKSFPSEDLLCSKIKEVNGMDHSNHFIEQYFRQYNCRSPSPEISENSTNSSSIANESMRSSSQEESCSSTGIEISNTESDSNFIDATEMDNVLRNSRYSKNAAIIGLLKNNIISLNDLELNDEDHKFSHSVRNGLDHGRDIQEIIEEKIAEYPCLVPDPEEPDVFTNPLQAYGRANDTGIDYGLPRMGEKTIITPRQIHIHQGFNDDIFTFKKKTTEAPEPKFNINIPKISSASSSRNQNYRNGEGSNSYNLSINDENDGFRLNGDEFPTLLS